MESGFTTVVSVYVFMCMVARVTSATIQLPPFSQLKENYPGSCHHGGHYRNHDIVRLLGIEKSSKMLLHDSSALRLAYSLNKIGNQHSLGSDVIRLSRFGIDSVPGTNGLQYMFHPLAFGPYLADKYGYPSVTKMHLMDPIKTKESFRGKQGIMRVITYTQHDNQPRGHVALWDCNGFFKARDFFAGHTLLSVEFWQSPDSDCSNAQMVADTPKSSPCKHEKRQDTHSVIMTVLKNMRHPLVHRKHRKHH